MIAQGRPWRTDKVYAGEGFAVVYLRHLPWLNGYARKRTAGTGEDFEGLAQRAMVSLWRHYRGWAAAPDQYIRRALCRQVNYLLTRRRRRVLVVAGDVDPPTPGGWGSVADYLPESLTAVERAVVLAMCDEGCTGDEVAARMGWTHRATAHYHWRAAVAKVRASLE